MGIRRDRENINIWLSESKHVNSALCLFFMIDCKPFSGMIYMGTNLSVEYCPTTPTEVEDMYFFH
jgi:hypothetical protein